MIITRNQLAAIREQFRQRTEEGYTKASDCANGGANALARAAACYALAGTSESPGADYVQWPWQNATFKPRSVRENLVRAAALIFSALDLEPESDKPYDGSVGVLTGCKVLDPAVLEEVFGLPTQNIVAMSFEKVQGTRRTFQLLLSDLTGQEHEFLIDLEAMVHVHEHLTDQVRAYKAAPDLPDLVDFINRQKEFSEKTFGPGMRTEGVLDHIGRESDEIRANPSDVGEWVDMILLSLEGAWRAGHTAENITRALEAKLARNKSRQWPDWRKADTDKAIEHIRGKDD